LSFTMLKLAAFILLLFVISQTNAGILETAFGDEYDSDVHDHLEGLITNLDQNSFNKTVHCSKDFDHCTAYFVMFYNSNSEVSRDFSLKYVTMAVPTLLWSSFVKLGAVDCADAKNKKLCTSHGFKRMPLFKYFGRRSIAGNVGKTVPSYTNGTIIWKALAAQINREYQVNSYSDWPNFTPLPPFDSMDDLWNYSGGHDEIMLIYVEGPNDLIGMTMSILAHKAADGLPVRIAIRGHMVVQLYKGNEYPAIGIIKRAMMDPKYYCTNPEAMKRESIFKNAMTRLDMEFKPADHGETIHVGGQPIYTCKNYTDSYRYKRNVEQIVLDPTIKNKEMMVEIKAKQLKEPFAPTLIELKKKFIAKP